jgi:zinc protease
MKAALLALALAAACGPRTPRANDDVPWQRSGVDWTKPPAVAAAAPFAAPKLEEFTLANSLRVVLVTNHRLPIVAITSIHTSAGGREDHGRLGMAAFTADLLDETVERYADADAFATAIQDLGARLDVAIASDHASVHVVGRSSDSKGVRPVLELLHQAIRKPAFAEHDSVRVRARRVAELTERRDRSRTVAAQIFDRVVFGAHPYALPAEGTPESVATLASADARMFWRRNYRPDATTIVIAGNAHRDQVEADVNALFGDWVAPASEATQAPPPLPPFSRTLGYVDTPGAEQTVVIIGTRASRAGEPDQLAADVANAITGGGPGARLDRKLHDELAATFGAGSSFWRGQWAGSWAIATTFQTARTIEGVRATLAVIETARTTDATAAEVADARANLARVAAQGFETSVATVRSLERVIAQGRPPASFATFGDRLAAVTPASARAAVETAWAELAIVVVGDWGKIGAGLRELGLPVVQYRHDGTRVP